MQNVPKLIVWLTFVLGVIIFLCGGLVVVLNVNSNSSITLLGQKITTGSVGLAMIFIGGVLVISTFKRIINLVKSQPPKGTSNLQVVVSSEGSNSSFIPVAMVHLLVRPSARSKHTDEPGIASFFYNTDIESFKYEIAVNKDG